MVRRYPVPDCITVRTRHNTGSSFIILKIILFNERGLTRRASQAIHLPRSITFDSKSTSACPSVTDHQPRTPHHVTSSITWRNVMSVTLSVGLLVGRSVAIMNPAKTAEPIQMPFGMWTGVGPENHVLAESRWRLRYIRCGAHWCHLANTIEPIVCDGDAALCQITLTTCCPTCFGL